MSGLRRRNLSQRGLQPQRHDDIVAAVIAQDPWVEGQITHLNESIYTCINLFNLYSATFFAALNVFWEETVLPRRYYFVPNKKTLLQIGLLSFAVLWYLLCWTHWLLWGIIGERREYFNHTLRARLRNKTFQIKPLTNVSHPHPECGAIRNAADNFINSFATDVGLNIYSKSMSATDKRRAVEGDHAYYCSKDLALASQEDIIQPFHVLKFLDVDYYVSPSQLIQTNPTLMYTFTPETLDVYDKEYTAIIQDDDSYITTVRGSSPYRHKVWDYSVDNVTLFTFRWKPLTKLFGRVVYVPTQVQFIMSHVDVRKVAPHRSLVGIFPSASYTGFRAIFYNLFLRSPLARLSYGSFCKRMDVIKEGARLTNLKFKGNQEVLVVETSLLNALRMRIEELGSKSTSGNIERILHTTSDVAKSYVTPPTVAAPILHHFRMLIPGEEMIKTFDRIPPVVDYQPLVRELACEDGKVVGRAYGLGYMGNSIFSPVKCVASDIHTVEGRINKPRNKVKSIAPFYAACMTEFLNFLIPTPGIGVPKIDQEVKDKQNRPSQRAGFEAVHNFDVLIPMVVSAFQKGEAYSKMTEPRNISNVNTVHKLKYSAYTYEFMEVILKNQTWYAFGKTPSQLADYLHSLALNHSSFLPTDFSRFDGSLTAAIREVERAALLRFFAAMYHQEVLELYDAQFDIRGYTQEGIPYDVGTSRLSGSAETAGFNSLDNAFISYCGYRRTHQNPMDAWNALGCYGGDDGLNPDMEVRDYAAVCNSFGLKFKGEVTAQSITFLGRTFPNLWESGGSYSDIKRALSKLHWTADRMATPELVAQRKALSLQYSDPITPILSDWSKKILHAYGLPNENIDSKTKDYSWWYLEFRTQSAWPIVDDPQWLEELVARDLDTTPDRIRGLIKHIREADVITNLDNIWTNDYLVQPEKKVEIPVLYDGEILGEIGPSPIPVAKQNKGKKEVELKPQKKPQNNDKTKRVFKRAPKKGKFQGTPGKEAAAKPLKKSAKQSDISSPRNRENVKEQARDEFVFNPAGSKAPKGKQKV